MRRIKLFLTNLLAPSPKKIWILAIALLILFVLAVILFPQARKPKIDPKLGKIEKPKITSITESQQTTEKIAPTNFSVRLKPQEVKNLSKTKTIKVYKASPFREKELDKVKKLVKALGFSSQPKIKGKVYTWRDGLKMARYDDEKKFFEYYNQSFKSIMAPSVEKLNKEKSISAVKQKLKDYLLYDVDTPLTVISTKFLWQAGMEIGETSDLKKANLMEINLTPQIDGYNVLADYYNQPLTAVRINLAQEITSITHHFAALETGDSGIYPLLAVNQAVEKIKNKEGVIVGIQGHQLGYDVLNIKTVQLTSISLAYLAKDDYLMPVYVFTGNGIVGNKRARVTVFLVGLEKEWLQ